MQAALLMSQEQVLALLLLLEEGGLVASDLRAVTGEHVLQFLLLGSEGKGTERVLEVGRRGIVIVASGSRWSSLLRRSRDLRTKESHGVATLLVLDLINDQPHFFLDSTLVRARKQLILIATLRFLDLVCVSPRWRHRHLSLRSPSKTILSMLLQVHKDQRYVVPAVVVRAALVRDLLGDLNEVTHFTSLLRDVLGELLL